ncbi:MAG: ATP-binding protein [Pseudomonadota bacterium]
MGGVLRWLGRRRPWPATLRGQLICLLLLALVLSQAVAAQFFFGERIRAVQAAFAGEALSRMASVALLLERTPETGHARILAVGSTRLARLTLARRGALARTGSDRMSGFLRARLLRALQDLEDRDWRERVRVAVRRRHGDDDDDHDDDDHRRRGPDQLLASIALDSGQWLTLQVDFPRPPLQWAWPALVQLVLAAFAIVLIVTLTIGRTTRSLRMLAGAADRFGRGARDEPVPPRGPVEARRLITAFNAMQERLARYVADRTRLLAAISHDLKTPITTMRLRAELVEDEETRAKLLAGLDEMQRIVEATLAFAHEEAAEEPMRAVDLRALVESIAEDYEELGQPVTLGDLAPAVVLCRTVALRRALRNLIDNAVRYGGKAEVALTVKAGMARVAISDRGPGLPEDVLETMFEPFVRLEPSRNRETGGVGLGLSIARTILQRHGGDVRLENRAEGGLTAVAMLPVQTEHTSP